MMRVNVYCLNILEYFHNTNSNIQKVLCWKIAYCHKPAVLVVFFHHAISLGIVMQYWRLISIVTSQGKHQASYNFKLDSSKWW